MRRHLSFDSHRPGLRTGRGWPRSITAAASLMIATASVLLPMSTAMAQDAKSDVAAANAPEPGVAIITLDGQVGGHIGRGVRSTFDAVMLDALLKAAHADGVHTAIIAVDSPCGRIDEAVRVCDTIAEWAEKIRIVVYPRSASYEASPIALGARELAVWPGSHVGVPDSRRTFKFDRDGKPNQPLPEIHWRDESHVRGHIEAANRPIELNAAMYTLEQQMFWCPKHGIVWEEPENWELKETIDPKTGEVIPPPVVEEDERWIQLDGPETLLGLGGTRLHEIGLAQHIAMGVEDLMIRLGLSADTPTISYDEQTAHYLDTLQQQYTSLDREIRTYEQQLSRMIEQLGKLAAVIDEDDRNAINNARRSIGRTRSALTRAGRAIVRTEDHVLQRRVRDIADLRMLIETHSTDLERMARGSRDSKKSLERDIKTVEQISEAFGTLLAAGEVPDH